MKAKIENFNKDISHRLESGWDIAVFWLLASLAAAMLVLYFYFLTGSVFNIASRSSAESKISALKTGVSELESNYLSAIGGLDMEKAGNLGLKEFNKPIFASLDTGEKLSFNDNQKR